MSLNSTPRTWVAGEVVTAAEMNAEVRDGFTGIQAAWTAYTPALTNITVGNGTRAFKWLQIGNTVLVRGRFAAGGTTTYSAGTLGIAAPTPPHADYTTSSSTDHVIGAGSIQPSTRQGASVVFATTASGVFNFVVDNLASANLVTNTVPGTFGTTSVLTLTVAYETS